MNTRVIVLACLAYVIGTYWTIEVFYAWYKAWGDPHFDVWYSFLAYSGILAAGVLAWLALRTAKRSHGEASCLPPSHQG